MPHRTVFNWTMLLLCGGVLGCNAAEDRRWEEIRQQFVLAESPANAVSITAAKELVADDSEITVVGWLSGDDLETLSADKAQFVLSELMEKDGEHVPGHDPAGCPFCRQRAAEAPAAVVQFVDEQDRVVPIGAELLFQLKKGDVVVVRGAGAWNETLNLLSLKANGIHIRK